jgi:type II secretory pathway pseudopilin PulG
MNGRMCESMKKSTTKVTIIIIILVAAVIGYYSYLSNKSHEQRTDSNMTLYQSTISRDLTNDYPPTVKEVMKYYNDVMKCFYTQDCTDDEIEELGLKVRALYDDDLLAENDTESYLDRLKSDVSEFKSSKRSITSFSVPASTSVVNFTSDGYDFARIICGYNIVEGGVSTEVKTVYLLRRDENKRWKIYGWESENAFQAAQNAMEQQTSDTDN